MIKPEHQTEYDFEMNHLYYRLEIGEISKEEYSEREIQIIDKYSK